MPRPAKIHIPLPIIEHINKMFIWQYGWNGDNIPNDKPIPPKCHGSPVKVPKKNKRKSNGISSSP